MPKHNPQHIETVVVPKPEITYVRLVSRLDAKLYVTGKYSGQEYLFDGAGSVVDVDSRDVEWMLAKRQGERQCCGGDPTGNIVFALAEE